MRNDIWPHPIFTNYSTALFLSLYLAFECQGSFIYGSDSSHFSCLPLFLVVLLAFISPHGRTCRTLNKTEKQGVNKICCRRVTPRSNFPTCFAPAVACWWYSWHRWCLCRACACTKRQHFLEDTFKSWMTKAWFPHSHSLPSATHSFCRILRGGQSG